MVDYYLLVAAAATTTTTTTTNISIHLLITEAFPCHIYHFPPWGLDERSNSCGWKLMEIPPSICANRCSSTTMISNCSFTYWFLIHCHICHIQQLPKKIALLCKDPPNWMNDKPFIVHSGVINKLSKVTLSPEPEFSLWWIVSESKKTTTGQEVESLPNRCFVQRGNRDVRTLCCETCSLISRDIWQIVHETPYLHEVQVRMPFSSVYSS